MRHYCTLMLVCSLLFISNKLNAQTNTGFCGTSELMEGYYNASPAMEVERITLEQFTKDFTTSNKAAKGTATQYTIPVVFHVYDTVQGGFKINDTLIKTALKWLNEDYHGLNAGFNTVHSQFMPVRDTLDITFALARKDPSGNPTTGILYYPEKAGYANSTSQYLAQIAADAWDNYKYLNIYIMVDLYDNNDLGQSGVGTYPIKSLYDNKHARIVYNGKYLAYNAVNVPGFSSVLTHECGHVLNLIHTFEGGCSAPNDNIADTPPCDKQQGCHQTTNTPLNCNNSLVNAENFMDYNASCYKMFTKGQVARMVAALNTAPLISLWQPSNLTAVGLLGVDDVVQNLQINNIYPNPTSGLISFKVHARNTEVCTVTITDITGRMVLTSEHMVYTGDNNMKADITGQPAGLYLLQLKSDSGQQVFKVHLR